MLCLTTELYKILLFATLRVILIEFILNIKNFDDVLWNSAQRNFSLITELFKKFLYIKIDDPFLLPKFPSKANFIAQNDSNKNY
jgi:hypothetical protein